MKVKELIAIELQKISVKKYISQVLIANIGITFLVLMTSITFALAGGSNMPQVSTITVIDTLVKAVFVVWESVLIANLIIEEFRSKTILLLFSYPLNRRKVIVSKLLIISAMICVAMIGSEFLQNIIFMGFSGIIPLITYSIHLSDIGIILLTSVTSIALGLLPMYVGMLNQSTTATVVSSIAIVSLTISSGGQNGGGIIMMIPISITLGALGIGGAFLSIKKMLSEDIIL